MRGVDMSTSYFAFAGGLYVALYPIEIKRYCLVRCSSASTGLLLLLF